MSISNSIRLTLNIKDNNIKFNEDSVVEENIKGVVALVYKGTLSPEALVYKGTLSPEALVYKGTLSPEAPSYCPKCGCQNTDYDIIKNGSKVVCVRLPRISNRKAILKLKKQRYLCKHCKMTFCAQSSCIDFNRSISKKHLPLLCATNER